MAYVKTETKDQKPLPWMPGTGSCLIKGCPGEYDAFGRCGVCGDCD